jgi:hypothetical protein
VELMKVPIGGEPEISKTRGAAEGVKEVIKRVTTRNVPDIVEKKGQFKHLLLVLREGNVEIPHLSSSILAVSQTRKVRVPEGLRICRGRIRDRSKALELGKISTKLFCKRREVVVAASIYSLENTTNLTTEHNSIARSLF